MNSNYIIIEINSIQKFVKEEYILLFCIEILNTDNINTLAPIANQPGITHGSTITQPRRCQHHKHPTRF